MKLFHHIVALCILLLTNSLYASNVSFLNYSAMAYFEGKDEAMMNNAVNTALNKSIDGKKVAWNNPETGAFGYVVPSHTTNDEGRSCRNLKIFNSARHITGETNYKFCRINDKWKIV